MRVTDEPRQDVKNCGNKMTEMAPRINGTLYAPINISVLIATAFIKYEVLELYLNYTGLYDLFDSNPKYLSADEITQTLKLNYVLSRPKDC